MGNLCARPKSTAPSSVEKILGSTTFEFFMLAIIQEEKVKTDKTVAAQISSIESSTQTTIIADLNNVIKKKKLQTSDQLKPEYIILVKKYGKTFTETQATYYINLIPKINEALERSYTITADANLKKNRINSIMKKCYAEARATSPRDINDETIINSIVSSIGTELDLVRKTRGAGYSENDVNTETRSGDTTTRTDAETFLVKDNGFIGHNMETISLLPKDYAPF